MRKLITICVVAVVVFMSTPAGATLYGTVDAQINGGYNLSMATMIHPYDTTPNWYTGFTGQFRLTYSNMSPATMTLERDAFCIETQTISIGGTYPYSVRDAFEAPIPGGPADTGKGPMAAGKAEALKELWGRFHSLVNSNVTAAAFQLAVWEIVFEDLYVTSPPAWTVNSGMFEARDDGGDTHLAIVQANTWLGQIDGQGPKAQLYGLTNPGTQDLLIPEPATMVLLGLGVLMCRKFKKA